MRVRDLNAEGYALVAKLTLCHPLHLLAVAYSMPTDFGIFNIITEFLTKGKKNFRLFSRPGSAVRSPAQAAADQAAAFLAISVSWVKAAASLMASSASILRLISIPAAFRPCIKLE